MTTPPSVRRRQRARTHPRPPALLTVFAVLAGLAAVLGGALVAPGPAGAHSILVQTTPAAGDQLDALTEVRLDFASDLSTEGHQITVAAAGGEEVPAATYELPQANSLVARFDQPVPAGDLEIVWDVVAGDGHHERGRIPVTVTAAPPAGEGPDGSAPASDGTAGEDGAAGQDPDGPAGRPGDDPAGEGSADASDGTDGTGGDAAPAPDEGDVADGDAAPAPDDSTEAADDSGDGATWGVAAVVVAALGLGLAVIWRRRRAVGQRSSPPRHPPR